MRRCCTRMSTASAPNRCSTPKSPTSSARRPCRPSSFDPKEPRMSRRPLALALALAVLLPASASAEDLLQTYELARTGDPQLAAAESGRLAQKEGAVQARARLLPQINGSASLSRSHVSGFGDDPTTRSYSANLDQTVFNWSSFANLRGQRALSHAADYDLEAANDSLITRTSAAYFNVQVAIETLAAAEAAETALKSQFDYADKRLEVGLAPTTDGHEARATHDSARATPIPQPNALAAAYQESGKASARERERYYRKK